MRVQRSDIIDIKMNESMYAGHLIFVGVKRDELKKVTAVQLQIHGLVQVTIIMARRSGSGSSPI
jgi:hypothetical protein